MTAYTHDLVEVLSLPRPPNLPGLRWRPMRREDVPAIHRLLLAVDRADERNSAGTLDDAYREFDDPWINHETDSLVALDAQGEAVAMARVFLNPEPQREARAFLWGEVHPEHRKRGLGDFILRWMDTRGHQRLRTARRDLPRSLRLNFPDNLHDRAALVEGHGFRPIRYFFRMRRDLRQPVPDVPLPAGIRIRPYGPELDRAAQAAFNEAFSDHWGFEPVNQTDWQMFFVGTSSFRAHLTFLAMDGDEVTGFSINRLSPEENARQGIREGWIGQLGVRRPWRKRGVATALLCRSMLAFKAEGLEYATLGVDTENPTGALSLYEGLGFVADKRFVTFEKAMG